MMIALILPKRSFWQRKYKEIVSRFIISHQMTNLGLKKIIPMLLKITQKVHYYKLSTKSIEMT
jgi:hypothetical protein